jgi:hypothetical protein
MFMYNKMKSYLPLILMMLATIVADAQEEKNDKEKEEMYRHRITVMMANSHIPKAKSAEGQNNFFIVPTWGFDYDFWLNKKWAIGLHNDLVLQQYKIVKEEDQTEVERSYPIGTCIVGIYKPFEHLSFVTGIGKEIEKNESFGMWKIAAEYGFELPKAWELSLNLQYDNKFKAYDSWLFGIGISKKIK